MKATAIVLAGSRPARDPLAERFGTELKALIPVGGEPMVQRPVKALLGSDRIGDVIVVAQDVDALRSELPNDTRLILRESGGTIAATIEMLCFDRDLAWPLLVTTADHALLDEQMIEEFLDGAAGAERLDVHCIPILETAHVKLARRRGTAPVRDPIDG